MTRASKGPDLNGHHEEFQPPAIAYRKVPKPGFFNKFLHRSALVELPQHYPAADRDNNKNFDFAYLLSTGAIKEDRAGAHPEAAEPQANPSVIADQSGALALKNLADQEHRSQSQQSPRNLN